MANAEKANVKMIPYEEVKEKHDKKNAIDQVKAKIEEDYSNNGKVFQIENVGIVRANMKQDPRSGEISWSYRDLTNFTIKDLILVENVDTKESMVKFTATNLRGVESIIEDDVRIFNETKDFREALNSMHFSFKGNVNDLQDIRNLIVGSVLKDESKMYHFAGIREINGELVYITSNGALKANGEFDESLKVDVDTFKSDIKDLDVVTADEVRELRNYINNFNVPNIVYPILGSANALNFTTFLKGSKYVKQHILCIAGESDCGKGATVDNIIKPLINADYLNEMCGELTQANISRSLDESCTLPVIYDEHTVRNLDQYKLDALYRSMRAITENATKRRVGKDNKRINYDVRTSMILLGENVPKDISIVNRCNVIFMSKKERNSKKEYEKNFKWLMKNSLLLKKIGYTVKRYILENYNQERFDGEMLKLEAILNNFELGSREFDTLRVCVFGIQSLNNAVYDCTGECLFSNMNEIIKYIYENIIDNVAGGPTNANADYIDVLERIDMMILDGTLSEGWQYFYDRENGVVKLDIPTIFNKMEEKKISFNMSRGEFTKKLIKSDFIAGETAKEYYKIQRVATKYCVEGKKGARRNVHLLKMSVCNKYEFFGLGDQLEIIE